MRLPLVINVDSRFDWTNELNDIWAALAWEEIRRNVAQSVDERDWNIRRERLVVIGLCAPETIDNEYFQRCRHHTEQDESDNRYEENWKNRQIGASDNQNMNASRRLTGEEPFLRSPVSCNEGIFEAYGFYTHNSSVVLEGKVDMDKVPLGVHGGAGIFLCPERITDIYPKLMTLGFELQHPIPLSSNPTVVNLEMTLLHELGHHFFPVHNSGAGKYISEALANYFCVSSLKEQILRRWLLYKTWHLQPPEYSAYRFIELLAKTSGSLNAPSTMSAFSGSIAGWEELLGPEHSVLTHWEKILHQSEYTTMAAAIDYVPSFGLIRNLSRHLDVRWDNWFQHGHLHMMAARSTERIPADFLWDVHEGNSIFPWVLFPNIPEDIWSSWGMSTSHADMGTDSAPPKKLSWPEGPLFRVTNKDQWERIIKESPYAWAKKAAEFWLARA
jgi:hypothetical protein